MGTFRSPKPKNTCSFFEFWVPGVKKTSVFICSGLLKMPRNCILQWFNTFFWIWTVFFLRLSPAGSSRLPGGARPSQQDFLQLARSSSELPRDVGPARTNPTWIVHCLSGRWSAELLTQWSCCQLSATGTYHGSLCQPMFATDSNQPWALLEYAKDSLLIDNGFPMHSPWISYGTFPFGYPLLTLLFFVGYP